HGSPAATPVHLNGSRNATTPPLPPTRKGAPRFGALLPSCSSTSGRTGCACHHSCWCAICHAKPGSAFSPTPAAPEKTNRGLEAPCLFLSLCAGRSGVLAEAGRLEHLLQFTVFIHLAQDVATTDELAVDVE